MVLSLDGLEVLPDVTAWRYTVGEMSSNEHDVFHFGRNLLARQRYGGFLDEVG